MWNATEIAQAHSFFPFFLFFLILFPQHLKAVKDDLFPCHRRNPAPRQLKSLSSPPPSFRLLPSCPSIQPTSNDLYDRYTTSSTPFLAASDITFGWFKENWIYYRLFISFSFHSTCQIINGNLQHWPIWCKDLRLYYSTCHSGRAKDENEKQHKLHRIIVPTNDAIREAATAVPTAWSHFNA